MTGLCRNCGHTDTIQKMWNGCCKCRSYLVVFKED